MKLAGMKSSTTGIFLASLTFAAGHRLGRPEIETPVAREEGGMFVATTLTAAWIKPVRG